MLDTDDDQPLYYWSLLLINSVKTAKCFWITIKTTNKVWVRWRCVMFNHIKLMLHWKLSFNFHTKHFISPSFVYGSFISLHIGENHWWATYFNFLKLSPLVKSVFFNTIPFTKCVLRVECRWRHIIATDLVAKFQFVISQLDFGPPNTRLIVWKLNKRGHWRDKIILYFTQWPIYHAITLIVYSVYGQY